MSKNDSAKYAFFYVLSLIALIFMAISVGIIFFQIINKEIVDLINDYSGRYSDGSMKFAISAIIISAPIYFFTSKQIYKSLFNGDLYEDAAVRRWFTYLILLVSVIVMIVWLIATIGGFLDGELTTKSILKAIIALFISGTVFSFYLYDIKREHVKHKKDKVLQVYFYGSLAIVLLAFIMSIFVVESPTETRNRKLDNRVISNFQQIDAGIGEYYREYEKLPANIDELKKEYTYILEETIVNPIDNQAFEYKILEDDKYELCTTFISSNMDQIKDERNYFFDKTWLHESGYQCLNKKINVDSPIKEPLLR